jgi:hypothetical protein
MSVFIKVLSLIYLTICWIMRDDYEKWMVKCVNHSCSANASLSLCLIKWALRHENKWGSGGTTPPFLISAPHRGEWSGSRPSRFNPGEIPSVPIEQEAGWAPEPVWPQWSREKSLVPTGNQTRAVQPVARRYTYTVYRDMLKRFLPCSFKFIIYSIQT